MSQNLPDRNAIPSESASESEYEAPRVETVLTADDVEREALYGLSLIHI